METESSVSTIHDRIVRQFYLDVSDDSQPLFGYGNAEKPSLYSIGKTTLKVTVDMASAYGVEFVVVSDGAQINDVIISRPFTALEHVAYVKKGDTFVFGSIDRS